MAKDLQVTITAGAMEVLKKYFMLCRQNQETDPSRRTYRVKPESMTPWPRDGVDVDFRKILKNAGDALISSIVSDKCHHGRSSRPS